MKIEDIKPGMIVVTRNRRVYVVHATEDRTYHEPVGIRKFGWVSLKFREEGRDYEFDIISVFAVKQLHALVGLYRSMSNVPYDGYPDEESIALLLNKNYFEQIYPEVRKVKKSELIKTLGYNFEIIEED